MYESDLKHPSAALEHKLRLLYDLRAAKDLTLGFRPEYLKLLETLGQPHLHLPPVIHVAGTNGKGSTIAILRAVLEAMGKTVHVYTSPHLKRFNERIRLAGELISDERLEQLIDQALEANNGRETTFFEITTAIAFKAFSQTPADFVLLEAGMGGRLDCTNIIETPIATIITAIGLDHQEHLGHTLAAIAGEKAGIIKPNVPCVIGYQTTQAIKAGVPEVFQNKAQSMNAPLLQVGSDWFIEPESNAAMHFQFAGESLTLPQPNLVGAHQIQNAGAALAALYALHDPQLRRSDLLINAMTRIEWPGRFQKIHNSAWSPMLPDHVEFWFDGGHNAEGAQTIAAQLQEWQAKDPKPVHLIFAMKGDKNAREFLRPIMPFAASLTHIDITNVSSFLEKDAFEHLMKTSYPHQNFTHHPTLKDALRALLPELKAGPPARILLCGSLYLAKQLP